MVKGRPFQGRPLGREIYDVAAMVLQWCCDALPTGREYHGYVNKLLTTHYSLACTARGSFVTQRLQRI
jgi:hypothetical protein